MGLGDAVRGMAAWACLGALAAGCSGAGNAGSSGHEAWSYQNQQGVTAILEPVNAALYRELLPKAFAVPQEPRLLVAVISYDDVTAPLVPYREGYVMLACTYQGSAGWYTLTMPVTDGTANDAGVGIGFPKYVADRIDLADGGGGSWIGEVVHDGLSVMRVAFTPRSPAALVIGAGSPGEPAFNLVPPGEGPTVYEVTVALHEEQRVASLSGTAAVTSESHERWVGLLEQARPVSVQFTEITGDWNLAARQR